MLGLNPGLGGEQKQELRCSINNNPNLRALPNNCFETLMESGAELRAGHHLYIGLGCAAYRDL